MTKLPPRRAQRLLAYLRAERVETKSNRRIADDLEVSRSTVTAALCELTALGVVRVQRSTPHPTLNPTGRRTLTRPRLLDEARLEFPDGTVCWGRVLCLTDHPWADIGEWTCSAEACVDKAVQVSFLPITGTQASRVAVRLVVDGDLAYCSVDRFVDQAKLWDGNLLDLVATCNRWTPMEVAR